MKTKTKQLLYTIKCEGALIPSDFLIRIMENSDDIDGLKPESYHLAPNEKINEVISKSWSHLLGIWKIFNLHREKLPEGDFGTSLTRERWLLPLFQEFGYGRLPFTKAAVIDNKEYPVSHFWHHSPVHLLGFKIDLDKRAKGVAGAAQMSPHSMIQEFLNRSDDHLWAFLSNGLKLRILRDNVSLVRQSFIEFDIEQMMSEEVYSDFALLWMLCHQSRVEADKPEECWLEKWTKDAYEQGTRALERLRSGVEESIRSLGKGFISHSANTQLKDKLRSGELKTLEYYHQLLRTVYRMIFLFTAEDRDLLHRPDAPEKAKMIYNKYYSLSTLRELASKKRGTRHCDLWRRLNLIFEKLGNEDGCPELGLSALGSFLWSEESVPDLRDCELSNNFLLDAVRNLTLIIDDNIRMTVNFKNLGPEELGSVYESLLELHPVVNIEAGMFELNVAPGHERKTTGSYYTPTSLINCLLDSALNPVLEEAAKKKNAEESILNLKICDPASGSGHFLIAAAHRIAKRLASVRTKEYEPSPTATRTALRDVIGRCIYGVDINPMAVELCKINLWMEAIEPGKPLSFLDHHIKCGNSLIGTTPALMAKGIPDEAFNPIEGDDNAYCASYKRQNRVEREGGQKGLFDTGVKTELNFDNVNSSANEINSMDDSSIDGINKKEKAYKELVSSETYRKQKFITDSWCAAFFWKKTNDFKYPLTEQIFRNIERNPDDVEDWLKNEVNRLADQYQYFHWHIEFPLVFNALNNNPKNEQMGWNGGFDVVLGNPPWERIKLQEKEWFAEKRPDIANASNASVRKKMIMNLKDDDPAVYRKFIEDCRQAEGESHFVRDSSKYPLCGRGDVNTYTIFAELKRNIINNTGRVGCIVPSGIATDDTTKYFFQDLINKQSLVSLYDFENRKGIFQGIHRSYKFCLLTMSGYARPNTGGAEFIFFALNTNDLKNEGKKFRLTSEDIALINPNTKTCPIFRSKKDAVLNVFIYRRTSVLKNIVNSEKNNWNISFMRMIDMANDSRYFRTHMQLSQNGWVLNGNIFRKNELQYLPLYEAKMIWYFDNRWATYYGNDFTENHLVDKQNPEKDILPRYWIPESEAQKRLMGKWQYKWLLVWRKITGTTNERTFVCSLLPLVGFGDSGIIGFPMTKDKKSVLALYANISSFTFDYLARQKLGGNNMAHFITQQLPVIKEDKYFEKSIINIEKNILEWITIRIIELSYTFWNMAIFAKDYGFICPPFKWDEERRFLLRCELDALYFHLYKIERNDVEYIMETFPIVKRKDEKKYGEYRTKQVILEIYDAMAEAQKSGKPYKTLLYPPPADPSLCHPPLKKIKTRSI